MVGDLYNVVFRLALISRRPVTYGITVSELGEDKVHEFQGKEPSGRKQSAIALDVNSKLEWQEP